MRKLDGYKALPKHMAPGTERDEQYDDVFLDGICLLTGTVDMSNFFSCMERKHSCNVGKEWFTVYSLYREEIKELYQFLIVEDGKSLEIIIDTVFRLKSTYLSSEPDIDKDNLVLKIRLKIANENVSSALIRALIKIVED